MVILIDQGGAIQFLWDDDLAGLLKLGLPEVVRASHVEPTAEGRWTADLSPVEGPFLGPFELRSDALAAETDWLEENYL